MLKGFNFRFLLRTSSKLDWNLLLDCTNCTVGFDHFLFLYQKGDKRAGFVIRTRPMYFRLPLSVWWIIGIRNILQIYLMIINLFFSAKWMMPKIKGFFQAFFFFAALLFTVSNLNKKKLKPFWQWQHRLFVIGPWFVCVNTPFNNTTSKGLKDYIYQFILKWRREKCW